MGRNAIHNWEGTLKEYLTSEFQSKSEFSKAKGIKPNQPELYNIYCISLTLTTRI
jgi:hypothetical protein